MTSGEGLIVDRLVAKAQPARRAWASPGALVDRRADAPRQVRDVDRYNRRFYERCWRAASLLAMPGVRAPPKPTACKSRSAVACGRACRSPRRCSSMSVRRPARSCGAPARASSVRASTHCRSRRGRFAPVPVRHPGTRQRRREAGRELARVSAADGWLVLSTPSMGIGGMSSTASPAMRAATSRGVGGSARRIRVHPRSLCALRDAAAQRLAGAAGRVLLVHRPRLAFRFQERFLRLTQRRAQRRSCGVPVWMSFWSRRGRRRRRDGMAPPAFRLKYRLHCTWWYRGRRRDE